MLGSELQFRQLLEHLPAGAYTCDPDGLITYYNQRAREAWGREPKLNDPEDRYCGSLKLFSTDGSPIAHEQCWMALTLRTGEEFNGREIVIERPNGSRVTVLAHATLIRDDSGKLLGAVNVVVDIEERKQREAALGDADRSRNEFLATLAHELRNPLAPIRNAARILHLHAEPSPESLWALDVIDRQMQQMTRLIDDLLDIARITHNKLELRRERIDLGTVIRAAVETSRLQFEDSSQKFEITLPSEAIQLDADKTRLAQAISNLLNNASKFTQRGGRISLSAERQGSQAVVAVRDNGIGIPAEMLPRVFEMFTQMDRSLERSQGGLGIGLTLVKRLVELHGGSVTASSEGPDNGSEFILRLPVATHATAASSHAGTAVPRHFVASSFRILVVEDNLDSAAGSEMLLKMMGNEVRSAHDGLEALELAEEFRPDVVLLDIGLPKMNGYDAARAIREKPWSAGMVLIAVTGWGQETARERSKAAGFDHHLVKPVEPTALLELLTSIDKRSLGSTISEPPSSPIH